MAVTKLNTYTITCKVFDKTKVVGWKDKSSTDAIVRFKEQYAGRWKCNPDDIQVLNIVCTNNKR